MRARSVLFERRQLLVCEPTALACEDRARGDSEDARVAEDTARVGPSVARKPPLPWPASTMATVIGMVTNWSRSRARIEAIAASGPKAAIKSGIPM